MHQEKNFQGWRGVSARCQTLLDAVLYWAQWAFTLHVWIWISQLSVQDTYRHMVRKTREAESDCWFHLADIKAGDVAGLPVLKLWPSPGTRDACKWDHLLTESTALAWHRPPGSECWPLLFMAVVYVWSFGSMWNGMPKEDMTWWEEGVKTLASPIQERMSRYCLSISSPWGWVAARVQAWH